MENPHTKNKPINILIATKQTLKQLIMVTNSLTFNEVDLFNVLSVFT